MSLNFSGPGDLPIIREAQNMMNNGGGGNLGYFQGRKNKKEKQIDIFKPTDEDDSFTLSSENENVDFDSNENQSNNPNLTEKLKDFLNKFKK